MADEARAALESVIEEEIQDAVKWYSHPQSVDSVGDATRTILDAVDDYVAATWRDQVVGRWSERNPNAQEFPSVGNRPDWGRIPFNRTTNPEH